MVRKPSKVAVGRYFANVGFAQLCVMKNLIALRQDSGRYTDEQIHRKCVASMRPWVQRFHAVKTHHDNTNSDVLSQGCSPKQVSRTGNRLDNRESRKKINEKQVI